MGKLLTKRNVTWVWLILLLITPIVLWILPGHFFDDSEVIVCPSRLFFDIECFGCGITRAVMHFHNFQFEDAVYFNQLVWVVYPGLIFTWGLWSYRAAKRLDLLPNKS